MLKDKRIVLGVTGGIAAYKSCVLTRELIKAGAEVRAVMSENAQKFICPLTLETLSGYRVAVDGFERPWEIEHISLAKYAQLFIIAPATANIIAKLAHGIADDLLSTTALAMTCPVLIAPAMNSAMWKNPATQENVRILRQRGVHFVGPGSGFLACGDEDEGRMSFEIDKRRCSFRLTEPYTQERRQAIRETAKAQGIHSRSKAKGGTDNERDREKS